MNSTIKPHKVINPGGSFDSLESIGFCKDDLPETSRASGIVGLLASISPLVTTGTMVAFHDRNGNYLTNYPFIENYK